MLCLEIHVCSIDCWVLLVGEMNLLVPVLCFFMTQISFKQWITLEPWKSNKLINKYSIHSCKYWSGHHKVKGRFHVDFNSTLEYQFIKFHFLILEVLKLWEGSNRSKELVQILNKCVFFLVGLQSQKGQIAFLLVGLYELSVVILDVLSWLEAGWQCVC